MNRRILLIRLFIDDTHFCPFVLMICNQLIIQYFNFWMILLRNILYKFVKFIWSKGYFHSEYNLKIWKFIDNTSIQLFLLFVEIHLQIISNIHVELSIFNYVNEFFFSSLSEILSLHHHKYSVITISWKLELD